MKRIVVTIDFDETLTRKDVQEYAMKLMARGIEVWVVTRRYDDLHTHNYAFLAEHDDAFHKDYNNIDLWAIVDKIGLPRNRVVFTNMEWKSKYLQNTKAVWHLDDSNVEHSYIKMDKIETIGVNVKSGTWKQKCNRIINKIIKEK